MKNPKLSPACQSLCTMWDAVVAKFLAGGSAVPDSLRGWADSYRGGGNGQVEWEALPEPFVGALTESPAGIFLALNPGRSDLAFQGRRGHFAREIRDLGSYSLWAASWPYLRDRWIKEKGKNRHHSSRLEFLRTWTGEPDLSQTRMTSFELYPWHSTRVTARMRPSIDLVREWVWRPIQELDVPVFAFGAAWPPLLEALGLKVVDRLGLGGRPYGCEVPSRSITVFDSGTGVTVLAESHRGSAGPPSRAETERLREALPNL